MYTQFFSLKQAPFSIAPDPRYLFMSERHREALAHLLYGVGGGGGFVLLTGEIGAGKTTVCRCFMEQIPANCKLAYIFNPKLSVEELLLSVCDEFGITLTAATAGRTSVKTYVDAINTWLLDSHARAQNNVLIIDEAQNLSAEVLEQLRLLTNLETNERKLLQIILIGQPELRTMLARPELEQLAQRVIARYHLGSLTLDETGSYIQHRLKVAGAGAIVPFPRKILAQLHRLSKGVPRRINLLCDRALLGAYVENQQQVSGKILRTAAAEVYATDVGAAPRSPLPWPAWLAGVAAGAVLTGLVAWQFLPRTAAVAAGAAPAASAPEATAAPVARALNDSAAALRELAALWGESLPAGEPCEVSAELDLRCYQGKGGLDELRALDRPAVLRWVEDPTAPSYVILRSLSEAGATLTVAGRQRRVSLAELAARWDGAFSTFWRMPRGWRETVAAGDRGPEVDWLARCLAQINNLPVPRDGRELDAHQRRLLRKFQRDQDLKADGFAGPKTYIRLFQLGGGKGPRLSDTAPATAAAGGE